MEFIKKKAVMKELSKDGEFWESSCITNWFVYAFAVLKLLVGLDSYIPVGKRIASV